jgi:hypothetical protein
MKASLYGMLGTQKAKIKAKRLQSEHLNAWNSILESRSKKENWAPPPKNGLKINFDVRGDL